MVFGELVEFCFGFLGSLARSSEVFGIWASRHGIGMYGTICCKKCAFVMATMKL